MAFSAVYLRREIFLHTFRHTYTACDFDVVHAEEHRMKRTKHANFAHVAARPNYAYKTSSQ